MENEKADTQGRACREVGGTEGSQTVRTEMQIGVVVPLPKVPWGSQRP